MTESILSKADLLEALSKSGVSDIIREYVEKQPEDDNGNILGIWSKLPEPTWYPEIITHLWYAGAISDSEVTKIVKACLAAWGDRTNEHYAHRVYTLLNHTPHVNPAAEAKFLVQNMMAYPVAVGNDLQAKSPKQLEVAFALSRVIAVYSVVIPQEFDADALYAACAVILSPVVTVSASSSGNS